MIGPPPTPSTPRSRLRSRNLIQQLPVVRPVPVRPPQSGNASIPLYDQHTPTQQPGMSLFGGTGQNKPTLNLFGGTTSGQAGSSLFGTANASQPQQQSSLFGSSTAQAQPQSSSNLFGSSTAQTQPQSSSNLFGNLGNTQQQQQSSAPSGGLFGSLGTASQSQPQQSTTGGLFGGMGQGQSQPASQPVSQPANSGPLFRNTFGQALSNQQSTLDAQQAQSAYFNHLLERGRKRNNQDNGSDGNGDLPGLQLGLGDIARKVRNLGTGGPSAQQAKAGDTRA